MYVIFLISYLFSVVSQTRQLEQLWFAKSRCYHLLSLYMHIISCLFIQSVQVANCLFRGLNFFVTVDQFCCELRVGLSWRKEIYWLINQLAGSSFKILTSMYITLAWYNSYWDQWSGLKATDWSKWIPSWATKCHFWILTSTSPPLPS